MRKYLLFILFLIVCYLPTRLWAQSLPVGTPVVEDAYRREQLLGKLDSNVSFTVRPVYPTVAFHKENIFDPTNELPELGPLKIQEIYKTADGKGFLQLLPVTLKQEYNTHNPYSFNEGSMIPAAGYQTLFSAGFFARYKFLSIQFQPEFVYAQNKAFDGFTQAGNDEKVWSSYYYSWNNEIDAPERFGTNAYVKLFPGQSSIRITFDPVSFGLSTENLWWGPGVRNSIVMSNNAEGFPHLTLNTTRPIKTPIGSFEAQLISGRLEGSGYSTQVPGQPGNYDQFVIPKPNNWRYLSGLVVSYHPKWVPGLFLGLTRVFDVYSKDLTHNLNGYFPVFTSFTKSTFYNPVTGVNSEDAAQRDQLASIFGRWLWTGAQAEIYFEYGRNDHNWDLRDLLLDPEHSRAYIAGFKKIFKTGSDPNEHIQVSVEDTELGQPADDVVNRPSPQYYVHGYVLQGYTNNGKVIGAGIGPDGRMQTLDVSWFNGLRKTGFFIERYEHNVDFYYHAFDHGEVRRHWVDYSLGLNRDWSYKRILFSASLVYIDQLNYEWKFQNNPNLFYFNQQHFDANNFHFGLNITYLL